MSTEFAPILIWFSLMMGVSEEAAIKHWTAPKPQPSTWQRAAIKHRDGRSVGVYLRAKFDSKTDEIRPWMTEYRFDDDKLVAATHYFSDLPEASAKRLFMGWYVNEFGVRPPKPAAVQRTKDRIATYFVTPSVTWKWVTDGTKMVARVSSNERLPTALAEAIALGYQHTTEEKRPYVERYAAIHRSIVGGGRPLSKLRELMRDDTLPPLMKSDMELLVAMLLAAEFKRKSKDRAKPTCVYALLDEAQALAPSLKRDLNKLRASCRAEP